MTKPETPPRGGLQPASIPDSESLGILHGLRVVEVGQYVAAPLSAMLLGDQGADVLKIERPGGDPYRRHPHRFVAWNRGKRSLQLDLSSPDSLDCLKAIVMEADVLVENLRPGALARLGLSLDDCRVTNPGLVTCSITGYGEDGPYRDLPGWEPLVHARGGLQAGFGPSSQRAWRPFPMASVVAGLLGAFGVLGALLVRSKTGEGQHVSTSLFEACLYLNGSSLTTGPQIPPLPLDEDVPAAGIYDTATRRLQLNAAGTKFWPLLCDYLGRPDLDLDLRDPAQRAQLHDPEKSQALRRELQAIFQTKSAAEWESLLADAGIPGAECRTITEWMDHPQCLEAGLRADFPESDWGRITQVGPPIALQDDQGANCSPPRSPAPQLGTTSPEWTTERTILRSSSSPDTRGTTGALEDVRVADLSALLAGPVTGRLLAELGADVIKVERPGGEDAYLMFPLIPHFYLEANRSKRSALIDLRDASARTQLLALIGDADVVIENARPGTWERAGLDEDALRGVNPRLVYARPKGYGLRGPLAKLPAYEQIAQAATGMQAAQGGLDSPELVSIPFNDYTTPLCTGIGVLLGLLHRELGGSGLTVSSSLAAAATLLQSEEAVRLDGDSSDPITGGRGPAKFCRLYQTTDGWVALCAIPVVDEARVATALGLQEVSEVTMEARFATMTSDDAIRALDQADVAVAPSLAPRDLWSDEHVMARGLLVELEHDRLGRVIQPAVPFQLSRSQPRVRSAAPMLSEAGGKAEWADAELSARS